MVAGAWSIFHGVDLQCHLSSISDNEEARTRDITFKANGTCQGLSDDQKVFMENTRWVMPSESSEPSCTQLEVEIKVNSNLTIPNHKSDPPELNIQSKLE